MPETAQLARPKNIRILRLFTEDVLLILLSLGNGLSLIPAHTYSAHVRACRISLRVAMVCLSIRLLIFKVSSCFWTRDPGKLGLISFFRSRNKQTQ